MASYLKAQGREEQAHEISASSRYLDKQEGAERNGVGVYAGPAAPQAQLPGAASVEQSGAAGVEQSGWCFLTCCCDRFLSPRAR